MTIFVSLPASRGAGAEGRGLAYSVALTGEIDPPAAISLERAIDDASQRRAAVVIVRLDTPGGLVESTRAMVRTIAAAPMPVVVYVHPSGGRADSAGLIVTLAADVAAMAPETNIGSATPVRVGAPARTPSENLQLQDLRRKAINGFVAFARTLAEEHGRNAALAERMIRVAENVSARTARRRHLVDVLASNERALLRSVDGFAVTGPKATRLRTRTLRIEHVDGAALSAEDPGDLEDSSLWRSLAYVFGAAATIVLAVSGFRRAGPSWRRWRRGRRRLKARRR